MDHFRDGSVCRSDSMNQDQDQVRLVLLELLKRAKHFPSDWEDDLRRDLEIKEIGAMDLCHDISMSLQSKT